MSKLELKIAARMFSDGLLEGSNAPRGINFDHVAGVEYEGVWSFSPRLERHDRVMAHECAYACPRWLPAVMGGEHRLKPEPLRGSSRPS